MIEPAELDRCASMLDRCSIDAKKKRAAGRGQTYMAVAGSRGCRRATPCPSYCPSGFGHYTTPSISCPPPLPAPCFYPVRPACTGADGAPHTLHRARGARDPRSKAAAREGPHPRSAPPVQIKKVWQCWPPWPGKLRKYGKLHGSLWKPKKPWQRP